MSDGKIRDCGSRTAAAAASPLLRIRGMRKQFRLEAGLFGSDKKQVYAVNGVSLTVAKGETYGLVGESGSGKSTLAKCLVNVYPYDEGEVLFYDSGTPYSLDVKSRKKYPALTHKIKYIFQDPAASLNPRMTVEEILTIGVRYAKLMSRSEARQKALFLTDAVGLTRDSLDRRPADFSGGQRQRISLARALMSSPDLLICDEVVSALDVSVQGQILNLLTDLKKEFGFSMLFIAHDLGVVSYISDRIGVMYGGRLTEEAEARELFSSPMHPYTRLLLASVPRADGRFLQVSAGGEPFDAVNPPPGCPFAPRCPFVNDDCRKKEWLSGCRNATAESRYCLCLKCGQLSR